MIGDRLLALGTEGKVGKWESGTGEGRKGEREKRGKGAEAPSSKANPSSVAVAPEQSVAMLLRGREDCGWMEPLPLRRVEAQGKSQGTNPNSLNHVAFIRLPSTPSVTSVTSCKELFFHSGPASTTRRIRVQLRRAAIHVPSNPGGQSEFVGPAGAPGSRLTFHASRLTSPLRVFAPSLLNFLRSLDRG